MSRTKIREYLMERDIPIRAKTPFEKVPCYLCKNFDPWVNLVNHPIYGNSSSPFYDPDRYIYEYRPCELRRNYCRTFECLCKKYEEAGKTFWSAERWRIKNKPDYHYMNYNLFRTHSSGESTKSVDSDEGRM